MGSYPTYLSLVKLQPWFLRMQWKTCPWAEHSDDDDDDDRFNFVSEYTIAELLQHAQDAWENLSQDDIRHLYNRLHGRIHSCVADRGVSKQSHQYKCTPIWQTRRRVFSHANGHEGAECHPSIDCPKHLVPFVVIRQWLWQAL